jgi:hypothetical protein
MKDGNTWMGQTIKVGWAVPLFDYADGMQYSELQPQEAGQMMQDGTNTARHAETALKCSESKSFLVNSANHSDQTK